MVEVITQNPASSALSAAACNPTFQMLSCLIGAAYVLTITYRDVEDSLALVVLTYTMAAITVIQASSNVCS